MLVAAVSLRRHGPLARRRRTRTAAPEPARHRLRPRSRNRTRCSPHPAAKPGHRTATVAANVCLRGRTMSSTARSNNTSLPVLDAAESAARGASCSSRRWLRRRRRRRWHRSRRSGLPEGVKLPLPASQRRTISEVGRARVRPDRAACPVPVAGERSRLQRQRLHVLRHVAPVEERISTTRSASWTGSSYAWSRWRALLPARPCPTRHSSTSHQSIGRTSPIPDILGGVYELKSRARSEHRSGSGWQSFHRRAREVKARLRPLTGLPNAPGDTLASITHRGGIDLGLRRHGRRDLLRFLGRGTIGVQPAQ